MPSQKNGAIVRQVVGYDRLVGECAYRQLTELYRALRRSRQLLPALDEAAVEATGREKGTLCLRFSEDSPAALAAFLKRRMRGREKAVLLSWLLHSSVR
jgi:hypothetical protein